MTRGSVRTVPTPRERVKVYLARGENLFAAISGDALAANPDAIAIMGVQAAIAFGDAFTIATMGMRSKRLDNGEQVSLVARAGTSGSAKVAAQLQLILAKKSEVEYGDQDVSDRTAGTIARRVAELRRIVCQELGRTPGPPGEAPSESQ